MIDNEYEMPSFLSACRALRDLAQQDHIVDKLKRIEALLSERNAELVVLGNFNDRKEYASNSAAIATIRSARSAVKLEFANVRDSWL
jgi:hypothetical protein